MLEARGREYLESFAEQLQERANEGQLQVKTHSADVADPTTSVAELFSWLCGEIPQLEIFVANLERGR